MITRHPLDILFLTNFSDYCYRSIPALAQMADMLKVRLTLMHVYNPKRTNQTEASSLIRSFFPEADKYTACQRVAVPGPRVIEAVREHLEVWPINLIVAPASDPIGIPRIGEPSLRARLIDECGVPVWTIGRGVDTARLVQPVRNVACWLDFRAHQTGHLQFAIEYAWKMNATLHVLRALPLIHEGSLLPAAHPDKALHPDMAADEILDLCAGAPVLPKIHVCSGDGRSTLRRMLKDCAADVVFQGLEDSLLARWLGLGLPRADFGPCPAICIGNHLSIPVWNLERGAAHRDTFHAPSANGLRSRQTVSPSRNGTGKTTVLSKLGLL